MTALVPAMFPGLEYSVEVGIGSVGDPDTFVYDDPGSVYDSAKYSAGEISWNEVATRGLRFQTNRGRDTWGERFRTGNVTVTFDNDDGVFNPEYGASLLGQLALRPGRFLRISARVKGDTEWAPLFVGEIEAIDEAYPGAAFGVRSTFRALDLMARLQADNPPALGSEVPAERTDLRAGRVLEAAGWSPGSYDFDAGTKQIAASTLAASRLQEIQAAAQAEGGAFYFDRTGAPRFRNFNWLENGELEGSVQFWAGVGLGVEIASTGATWDLGRVRNDVRFARAGGTEQRAQNPSSIGYYGQRTHTQFDFQNTTDSAVFTLAERYLERFAWDRLRLSSLTLIPFTDEAGRQLLELDVGHRIRVTVQTHGGGAGSWDYTADVWVQRIQHVGSGDDYECRVTVDNVDTGNPFIGGPFSRGYALGFKVNENQPAELPSWAAVYPVQGGGDTHAGWYNRELGGAQEAESFSLRALHDWGGDRSGQVCIASNWAELTTGRSWRLFNNAGDLRLSIYGASGAATESFAYAGIPFVAGEPFWLRFDYDRDTGALVLFVADPATPDQWQLIDSRVIAEPMVAPTTEANATIGTDTGAGTLRRGNGLTVFRVEYRGTDSGTLWVWDAGLLGVNGLPAGPFGIWQYINELGADPAISQP